MSELTSHPAYLLIADQLDAIGQKYRLVRLVRGVMFWTATGALVSLLAAIGADAGGPGVPGKMILGAWLLWLITSAYFWLLKPLLHRPTPVAVARLVERRVQGLNDGLTNSVLLAGAADLAESPWTGRIFDEILAVCREKPLESAVRFSELTPLAMRLGAGLVVLAIIAALMPGRVAHGWEQMFAPDSFVPKAGRTQILEVTPGDVTLVAGQALEIGVVARAQTIASSAGATIPAATVIFYNSDPAVGLQGNPQSDGAAWRYAYRVDHVDSPMRYRVEVGDSQSAWFTVALVPKIALVSLDVQITPPVYTRQVARTLTLKSPDELQHAHFDVPQGSDVTIGATTDIAVKRVMLVMGADSPLEMTAALQNHRFFRQTRITADTVAYAAVLSGAQIIAKLPENGVAIHCVPDSPPTVAMQWPMQDVSFAPTDHLTITATLHDDYGVSSARLFVGTGEAEPAVVAASEQRFPDSPTEKAVQFILPLTAEQSKHGNSITVQVEATDNRDLTSVSSDLGPQSSRGPKRTIHFEDPRQIAAAEAQQSEKLSARLQEMTRIQQYLLAVNVAQLTKTLSGAGQTTRPMDRDAFAAIGKGQTDLQAMMRQTATSFEFDDRTRFVQKILMVLAANAATDAVDLSSQIVAEALPAQQAKQAIALKSKQESIIETLQSLLARLNASDEPTTQPTASSAEAMAARVEAFKKLDQALKDYEKEQSRVLNQTAPLAKKPVADYGDKDKKALDGLKVAQDKLDAFMQEALADFSKNAEQDMSNPSLLKELMSVYTEGTMAANALKEKSAEIAVPIEENGLEQAQELETNIEKWLANKPDRIAWTQEDPLSKTDTPMPELPKELDDIIGKLLEQQEDLDQQMEDANANMADSMDKAVGWDAMDGPIADMSAKGVTGNALPNDNEMQGRSGEGRSGNSDGEFVGDTANGKGGRNTPTRLTPTPFESGTIKDTSKDPAGGATGGGKVSGEGSAGLEGPVPPKTENMQRLAKMQAQIRNSAEKLNLQYSVGRYDNFKLLQSIVNMRRTESDLNANRYQNALRRSDVMVDDLNASAALIGGGMQVEEDATPTASLKTRKEIDDATQGELPPVWSAALREYYRKLSEQ